MRRYLIKRLFYITFIFFVMSVILFIIYKAVPGDPAIRMVSGGETTMRPEVFQKLYDEARLMLGLDQPIHLQYIKWIGNLLRGEFGYSIVYKMPVAQMAVQPMQYTILLNICTLVVVFAITIPLGITTAVRKGKLYDNIVQVVTILGHSLPGFVVAIIVIYIFAIKLNIGEISGVATPNFSGTQWEFILDRAHYMLLPLITMVFSSLASITRYVRAAMIEALRMDYIRTARAKGLREKVVIYVHAFRNSLIPLVTLITGWFISLFSGSVVIEKTFLWNGMGKIMIDSLMQLDFAPVLAFQMFYVFLAVAGNLIMDIGYMLVDPRVKLT